LTCMALELFRTLDNMDIPNSVKTITLLEYLRLSEPDGAEDITICDILKISSRYILRSIRLTGTIPRLHSLFSP
jgi:hypothetical protein